MSKMDWSRPQHRIAGRETESIDGDLPIAVGSKRRPSLSKAKQRNGAQAAIKAAAGRLMIKRHVRCACGHHAIVALPVDRTARLKCSRCKAVINIPAAVG
jgi:hypothetical protein